jgi:ATP-dependent RNA helicase DeaD
MTQPQTSPPIPNNGFAGLGLDPRLLEGLTALGYEEPTPIQVAAIPPLLSGRDLLAQAATGTGKTAAFALPLLHRLSPDGPPQSRLAAMILVPTRELAMQVAEAVHRYGRVLGVRVLPVYGGTPMSAQIRSLRRGVDVVIATPGRALDHIRRESLELSALKVLVLDEADEMLDMGFAEDLEAILAATPAQKQTALFSATLPPRITAIVQKHLTNPVRIEIDRAVLSGQTTAAVRQVAYIVPRQQKMAALGRVLDLEHPVSAIVFCRTRVEVDELAETLTARGHRTDALHGGLAQEQRDRVMQRFRGRKTDLLIATDVAARGLDVQHVSHVVNYDVPMAADAYVHRIGRTGRAGRTGVAITLAEPREHRMLRNIERVTKQRIEVVPLPTVADLHARRREVARDVLRATILAGNLDSYRGVVEMLAEEFDVMDIAAAALKQGDTQKDVVEHDDIPVLPLHPAPRPAAKPAARPRRPAPVVAEPVSRRPAAPAVPVHAPRRADMTRLFVAGGRALHITAEDLVGAITNESNVPAQALGAIQIEARHATIEVPHALAEQVIATLCASRIKGKRIKVERDRFADGAPAAAVRPAGKPNRALRPRS